MALYLFKPIVSYEKFRRYDEFQKSVGNKMLALEIAVKDARSEQAKYDRDFNHFLVCVFKLTKHKVQD